MYWLERFGTTELPTQQPDQYVGTGQASTAKFIPLPGGGVFDTLGSEQAVGQGGTISCKGAVSILDQSGAALISQVQALRALKGKRDKLYRRWDNGDMEWIYARLVEVNAQRSIRDLNSLEMMFTFQQISPVWNGNTHGSGWYLDSGEYFDTGLVFDEATGDIFALDSVPKSITISNGGNAPVRDMVIEVYNDMASGAAITQIDIAISGKTAWRWTGSLPVGKVLTIDCGAFTVLNDTTDAYSGVSLESGHAIDCWIELEPGDNVLSVTRTGGDASASFTVRYNDGWQ